MLIVTSYLLYMNFKPSYALILLGITIVTFLFAKNINRHHTGRGKIVIATILTIMPLLVFKYYNFINESIWSLMTSVGIRYHLSGLNWAVPIGISFFTFQALGYLFDVYYKKIAAEKNFTDYLLFCSFFPQTASGPISKASELLPQIKNPLPFNYNLAREGLQLLLYGVFLKVVFADRLGIYVDTVYANYTNYSGITCFVASVFYTFQIYGDFAGYSLMAIGVAKILGYNLVNNFARPYFADSITNFWRRWHISLTRWLTAYVYIPLGGSRCSKIRQYWNIVITFLVSGLWHGANWTFLIWGGIHGMLQIVEKMLGLDPKGRYGNVGNKNSIYGVTVKIIRIFVTFMLVNFCWIFFRSTNINEACCIILKIITNETGVWQGIDYQLVIMTTFMIVIGKEFVEEYFAVKFSFFNSKYTVIRWGIYLFLIVFILLYGVLDSTQFIYVSF